MSDMTAIEKAREALIDVMRFLNARVEKTSGEIYHIDQLREAIAALEAEKPAEDSALSAVERWADEYYERPVLVGEVHRSLAVAFQSYARSYHLAECAKCKALPTDDVSERKA